MRLLIRLSAVYLCFVVIQSASVFNKSESDDIEILTAKQDLDDDMNDKLIEASEKGDEDEVRVLIENGADVNATARYDFTALHRAAFFGHAGTVNILLQNGADVNAKLILEGWTPLHEAAQNGYESIVKNLIEYDADIDAKLEMKGWSAMHIAAANGHDNVIRCLLKFGDYVDIRSYDDYTPLHRAANFGRLSTVPVLLENGANPMARSKSGQTPHDIAIAQGYTGIAAILKKATEIQE